MKIHFLFMDGVGLGKDDPAANPFVHCNLVNLRRLLGGQTLLADLDFPIETPSATLLALDACLGVSGLPQSATGQASLLTGINVPAAIGLHDGPKPTPEVAAFLGNGNLFSLLKKGGRQAALLNAFPPRYFRALKSGHRLPGAIAMAARLAELELKTADDLAASQALSADFTAQGWPEHLGITNVPRLSTQQAGEQLARLAEGNDFSIFEYWLSDVAGHRQDMQAACSLLGEFDQVLGSLVEHWDGEAGLILITSDHGNLEDLSTRRHTFNPVPLLLIGSAPLRARFVSLLKANPLSGLLDLTCLAPAILQFILSG